MLVIRLYVFLRNEDFPVTGTEGMQITTASGRILKVKGILLPNGWLDERSCIINTDFFIIKNCLQMVILGHSFLNSFT